MKRTLLLAAMATVITMSACKKKSKSDPDPFTLEYSNLSVEEQKKAIEKAGTEFIDKISSLQDEKSLDALANLGNLDFASEISSVSAIQNIGEAASQKNLNGLYIATVSASTAVNKLSDSYAVYTWSFTKRDWVKTSSNDKLQFIYPATEDGKTNNATLTFTYKASNVIATTDGGTEKSELPASASVTLVVDGKEELKYNSAHEYKSDGTPTKTDASLVIGAFTLKTEFTNNGSEAKNALTFSKQKETLLSLSTTANGTLNLNTVENEDNYENVVNKANVSFAVLNIKIAGQADFKTIEAAKKSSKLSGEAKIKQQADLWNTNSKLVAVNTKENKVIAKVEFVSEADDYLEWNYNYTTRRYEQIKKTRYILAPRLVFKDGSKQSFDEFTETGFSALTSDAESKIN